MTLIVGARCPDGVVLAADRRRLSKHERGPNTTKLFQLSCGVALAGAGDDAVLNEARIFIERRVEEARKQSPDLNLFDIVEIASSVVNELVSCYKDSIEESFGYVLAGLENLTGGNAKLYTIFGAGLSEVPWVCLGSGSAYARPLVELLLVDGNLPVNNAARIMATIFTMVANVQFTVGGGVDICLVRDGQGSGNITHTDESNLTRLKKAMLGAMDIKPN